MEIEQEDFESEDTAKNGKLLAKEVVKTIVIIMLFVAITKIFILEPFLVKGTSMEPNFQDNNYIFVQSISGKIGSYKRGDVVIFEHPESQCNSYIQKHPIKNFFDRLPLVGSIPPMNPCTNYIKRVIGLPEETVIIKDRTVTIKNKEHPDGFILSEYYIPKTDSYKLLGDVTKTMGKNEYFVLGDNRQPNASSDSRDWGVLPKSHITGKTWLRVFPFNNMGIIRRPQYQN